MHIGLPSPKKAILLIGLAVGFPNGALGQNAPPSPNDRDIIRLQDVVVTASPSPRTLLRSPQPVSVLSGNTLLTRRTGSLGETVAGQLGVSSSSYTAGASRPVIRGLAGSRVRMLESGIGSQDVSDLSEDHSVAINPFAAKRIEIVRGPAALLYGGEAIGGAVNVLSGRVPDAIPENGISGQLEGGYGTNARDWLGSFSLDAGKGNFAVHVDGHRSQAGDYNVPGESQGRLINSKSDSKSGGFGLSWVGDDAYAGAAISGFSREYGISGRPGVTLDPNQVRWDIDAGSGRAFSIFEGARFRLAGSNYKHSEKENSDTHITFENQAWESRLVLDHQPLAGFSGSVGVQHLYRDTKATGEERSSLAPTTNWSAALFLFEEIEQGELTYQLGGRVDHNVVSSQGQRDQSFTPLSGSIGLLWEPSDLADTVFGATVSVTQRAPAIQELFANGPHHGTETYDIGDSKLGLETGYGLELTARHDGGRLSGTANLFTTLYRNFIFERMTGIQVDDDNNPDPDGEFERRLSVASDALFWGAETEAAYDIWQSADANAGVRGSLSYVAAEERKSHDPLPRIPPLSLGGGVYYLDADWEARLDLNGTFRQGRISKNETTTGGFVFLDAVLARRFSHGGFNLQTVLSGRNLLDRRARNHASVRKNDVLLPGRDVRFDLKVSF